MADSADIIRNAREFACLTQAALAERSGIPQSSISAYERGRHVPSVETLSALLAATGQALLVGPATTPDPGEGHGKPTLELVRERRSELQAAGMTLGVSNIRIFGSVARGDDRPDSDVDMLVDLREPVGLIGLARIEEAFSDIIGRHVEIVPTFALRSDASRTLLRNAVPL